ncbi:TonB-dependent siderophore receptor [Burkholderia sp. LMU1-1-1.1]|uniref:TonB-dependent siderophore receptor n=1 Tax=Burkholderia sp. LMU1-1-1.1 TaxID=3135266 RepID=UPI0034467B23
MHRQEMPGTQLTPIARALGAGLFGLIFSAAAGAADTPTPPKPDSALPTINVVGEQETATGAVAGYAAKRSATGTKTDTPIIETPQSITVIGAEQIDMLKARTIAEALGYSVGGTLRAERTGDEITLRGFQLLSTFRDGTNYQVNRFDGQQEVYGLERIEVLKGASSILYGMSSPGGVLNTVSKRPTAETLRELNVEVGSFDRKQVSGDFAGALTEDGVWTYRLTGLQRDSGAFIDYMRDDRTYLAPALKWQPNAATSLTLLSEYQRDRSNYGADDLPAAGTLRPNIHGTIPRDRFTGEPDYDHFRIKRYSVGYILDHAFSDNLKLRHSLRKYHMDQDWASIGTAADYEADQRSIKRFAEDRDEHTNRLNSDTSLQYDWRAAGVEHKTLVGLDYTETKRTSERFDRAVGTIDLYAPVYGGALGPAVYSYGFRSRDKQMGLYFQDQMKFADKWVLLLGGRQDWVRQTECDFKNPSLCSADHEKSDAFTGRAGLVYLADNGLAPFVSFSQSFAPTSGTDRNGNRFDPTEGEQFEAGVRYQPAGGALMLSAATYQLTQGNVLTQDPLDRRYARQQGEVRSRGFELEARGRIGRNAQVLAAYTYTDARVTKASPLFPEQVGDRTNGVPYNQASLWGDYSFGDFGVPGLKIGAGARYMGETTSTYTDVVAPAYTVIDAMASYTTGLWRLALNVSNLTDKTFYTSCPFSCFYGEPRNVKASLSYRW